MLSATKLFHAAPKLAPLLGRLLSSVFLAASLFRQQALAQFPSGKLFGTVYRSQGQQLVDALAHLSPEGPSLESFEARTNSRGEFAFVHLPPGFYNLTISIAGTQLGQCPLDIRVNSTLEVTVTLSGSGSKTAVTGFVCQALEPEAQWGSEFGNLSTDPLPNARNIWSLLESREPSTVTNRIDVGGLETGTPALFGALGASWTENQYELNGFDVTDPYIPGRPLIDPDTDAVTEFRVVSSAKPAEFGNAGQVLMIGTPLALESLHGEAGFFYSSRETQSDNMDDRLRAFNFPGPERLNHLLDGTAQLGGKLPRALASWPAFVSVSAQDLSKDLGGFGAPIDAGVYRGLVEFTPVSHDAQRLNVLYSGQHIFNSRQGATPQVAPNATTLGNENFHQFQSHWERTLNPSTTLDLGFGAVHAITSSGIQSGVTGAATLDLPLMARTGPAPLSVAGLRTRWQASGELEAFRSGALGSHSVDLGAAWDRSLISNRWGSLGGFEQVLVEGAGVEVIQWNTPASTQERMQDFTIFAQDAWRPFGWVWLPVGLQWETASGRAAAAKNVIRWSTLEPRVGLVVPLFPRGPVLRASWSRYGHLLQGRYLDFGNPVALGGQVFRWQDLDGDGVAQPGEISQRLRVFGGPYSVVDRGLAHPFTDEISIGLEQDFGAGFRLSSHFFRRDDHRLIGQLNTGVPLSTYRPKSILDPGNDGIAGTADDQVLTLYDEIPSSLGQDFFLLTNPPGDRASFKGLEIRLSKSLRRLWEFSASFTAMQTLAPTSPGNSVFENDTGFVGSLYTSPNTLLYDTSRTYFDRAFVGKATGYYRAPGGLQLATVVKYYDGLPFGRLLFVEGFNQGPFFVRTTPRGHPGGFQTEFNFTLDARVAREFRMPRGTLAGYIDCFNVLNVNQNTLESDLTGPAFQSRVPLSVEPPRLVRLGLEWIY
jgi:hypothetical protein